MLVLCTRDGRTLCVCVSLNGPAVRGVVLDPVLCTWRVSARTREEEKKRDEGAAASVPNNSVVSMVSLGYQRKSMLCGLSQRRMKSACEVTRKGG